MQISINFICCCKVYFFTLGMSKDDVVITLDKARREQRITLSVMALEMGVSKQSLSQVFRQSDAISEKRLKRIALFLGYELSSSFSLNLMQK